MFNSVYFMFSIIVFLILVRECIIDIETLYVPDNITFALYSTSIVFLVFSVLESCSFSYVIRGGLGFLAGFGLPFSISFLFYLFNKFINKNSKEKDNTNNNSSVTINKDKISPKTLIFKKMFFLIVCVFISIAFSSFYDFRKGLTILIIEMFILAGIFISLKQTKKIKYPIYIVATGLLLIICVLSKSFVLSFMIIFAAIIEILVSRIFKGYYKIEYDSEEDETVGFGIGGGDILIFGGLGLMFGFQGVITIFIYSTISQLFVMFAYKMFSRKKSISNQLPFVPGIALGFYIYVISLFL